MAICDVFLRNSINTWDLIAASRTSNYQLKEETITDLNILELKKQLAKQVITVPFNKIEEGKNGADWEWWFQDKSGFWIGVRVQAKIIDIATNNFEHLHYKGKKKKKFQSEEIIRQALRSKPPRIPVYTLYSHWDDNIVSAKWTCGSFPKYVDLYGCSTMSALDVYKRRTKNERDLKSLLVDMKPWHCLICCKGYSATGQLTDRLEGYAKNNFFQNKTDILKELRIKLPKTFKAQDPPDYVQSILNKEISIENIKFPEYLDGIFIYKDEE